MAEIIDLQETLEHIKSARWAIVAAENRIRDKGIDSEMQKKLEGMDAELASMMSELQKKIKA